MLALLIAASLASPGPQASSTPILRHMVFSAHVDSNGGMSTAYRGANAGETGVPRLLGAEGHDDKNTTITVDVLAALDDGSLVVNVSEPKQEPLKVGITSQGALMSLTPSRLPTVGEHALLRMLARNFVAGHDDAAGNSWDLQYGPDNAGQLHVSVSKNDGAHVVLELKGTEFETQPETRRQQLSGTVTYDAAHTIPVSADLSESVQVQNGDGTESMQYQAQFTLQSDSMGGS